MSRRFPSFLDLNQVVVGIVSMAAIAVLCAGAFAVGALGLTKRTYAMSGVFTDASGVSKGADVQMAGVSIGTVTGVHPDFELGEVIITWSINRGVQLGTDTNASLNLSNLLGGEYVVLSGPVAPPFLNTLPEAQRRIPLSRTQTTFSVNGVLGNTAQALQAINPQTVNQVLADLAQVIGTSGKDLGPLLTNLDTVAAAINSRDADLRQLVTNSEQVTATLAAKNQQLGSLIDNANALLSELVNRRNELTNILGAGSSAVAQLSSLIASEQTNLQQILGDLHVAIQAAGSDLPQIDQGFAWAGPTFSDLATVGTHGHWFDVVAEGFSPDAVGILSQVLAGAK